MRKSIEPKRRSRALKASWAAPALALTLCAATIGALSWAGAVQAGAGAIGGFKHRQEQEKSEAAKPLAVEPARPIIKGATTFAYLKRSDTPFSPRFRRPDWTSSFKSFASNRVLWTYANGALMNDLKPERVPMQCTVPFWVPAKDPAANDMSCLAKDGSYGGTPADNHIGLKRPDVNSAAWRNYQIAQVKKLIDSGCTAFQQDDPAQNATAAPKGCYSKDSVTKFRTYLRTKYSAAQLSDLGVANASAVDIRQEKSAKLNDAYVAFQRDSVVDYHGWLHSQANAYIREKRGQNKIAFSANLTNEQLPEETVFMKNFDFMASEFYIDRENGAQEIRRVGKTLAARPSVSAITIASNDVWLNQRAIASAYAFGMAPIAPWDVFIGAGKDRFNGKPADFASLFKIVRSNPAMFDDYASFSDETGRLTSVIPIDGAISAAWTDAQVKSAIAATRAQTPGSLTPQKRIARNRYGMTPPNIKVAMSGDLAKPPYVTTIRLNKTDVKKKVAHIVSWRETGAPNISILLRRADFPTPPKRLITDKTPAGKQVAPIVMGDYYGYAVGPAMWAILAP